MLCRSPLPLLQMAETYLEHRCAFGLQSAFLGQIEQFKMLVFGRQADPVAKVGM
jgi:hypothetical protein